MEGLMQSALLLGLSLMAGACVIKGLLTSRWEQRIEAVLFASFLLLVKLTILLTEILEVLR